MQKQIKNSLKAGGKIDSFNGFFLAVSLANKFLKDLDFIKDRNGFNIKDPARINKLEWVIKDFRYLENDLKQDEVVHELKEEQTASYRAEKLKSLLDSLSKMNFDNLAGLSEFVDGMLDKDYTAILLRDKYLDRVVEFVNKLEQEEDEQRGNFGESA